MDRGALFSEAPPRSELKKDHPATFSENDIRKLVRFFSRKGQLILDPFSGSGSTAIACIHEERRCIGFELYERWHQQALKRIEAELGEQNHSFKPELSQCDALEGISTLDSSSIDFIVTSPPFWNILDKQDHKAKTERVANGLATNYGKDSRDLAGIHDYNEFLNALECHFVEYRRVLKSNSYVAVIVSDFRHRQKYYMFHADVSTRLESAGFTTQGLIVLIQDNKKLYPYGYPTTFVPNISNQYIVVARKLA